MMKRCSRTWVSIVLVALSMILFGPIALAQPQESVGKVAALEGRATVLHKGNPIPKLLALQSPLYQEDIIQTEAASKIKVIFVDGTVLSLGEKGTLQITTFVYSPQQKTRMVLFILPVGIFRSIVDQILPKSKFEVATTTAVAAIRGTDWMGEVTSDSSAFVVLKGKVDGVINANPDVSGKVGLRDGMGTTVKFNRPPTKPNKWGEARVSALMKATELP